MIDEVRILGDLQRLALRAGDILVLTTPMRVSAEAAGHLREAVEKQIPGHKVIILSDGLKLGVLEAAD